MPTRAGMLQVVVKQKLNSDLEIAGEITGRRRWGQSTNVPGRRRRQLVSVHQTVTSGAFRDGLLLIAAHPIPEKLPGDSEATRGGGDVAIRFAQRLGDQIGHHPVEGEP